MATERNSEGAVAATMAATILTHFRLAIPPANNPVLWTEGAGMGRIQPPKKQYEVPDERLREPATDWKTPAQSGGQVSRCQREKLLIRIKSSPMLGEHTDQVLSDWLGLNAQAVAELKSEGVV